MIKKIGMIVALLSLMTVTAFADRPLVTETPDVVPVGITQVEVGGDYARFGATKAGFYQGTVTTGVSKKAEIAVTGNYLDVRNTVSGLTDFGARLKYQFAPKAAVIVGSTAPSGATAFRTNYQPGIVLTYKTPLTANVNLLSNVGYLRNDFGGNRGDSYIGSVALTNETRFGQVFVEGFGINNKNAVDQAAVAMGLSRQVKEGFKVDGRVGRGISVGVEPNYFIGLGLTLTR